MRPSNTAAYLMFTFIQTVGFVNYLNRAVYIKNKVLVSEEAGSTSTHTTRGTRHLTTLSLVFEKDQHPNYV